MIRIIVLGAAAGGGFPQWNCDCPACRRARAGDPLAPPATQASVAFSADDRHWFLVNASPDLRQQIAATPSLHPRGGGRSSPIAGVILTNGDVDAVAGLLNLREGARFTIHGHPRVLRTLDANPVFGVLDPALVARRDLVPGAPVPLLLADGRPAGLEVEAFAVPGKVALWLEDRDGGPPAATEGGDAIGITIRETGGGGRFDYVANCAAVTPELRARLDGTPALFFDGTLHVDDEMIAAGLGTKTGRRMGHISMSGPDGAVAALADVAAGRRIFIHINNTNPVLLADSAGRAALERAGWEVAADGMEIRV